MWNTVQEEASAPTPMAARSGGGKTAELVQLHGQSAQAPRYKTHSAEFDRVLGGGLVRDGAVLIGGDPGIGKSTLLLQAAAHLSKETPVLYFSGEESAAQIQMRAKRMDVADADVKIATTGHLESILATVKKERAGLVIVDSIQTVFSDKT